MSNWNGEGLPPVGSVCEIAESTEHLTVIYPAGTRVKVYANFVDDRGVKLAAFVDRAGQVGGVGIAKCFRPIRSAEEVAVEAIADAMRGTEVASTGRAQEINSKAIYAAIRDGRIPGVKLEDA